MFNISACRIIYKFFYCQKLKEIEKIINEPTILTEFNREIFDTIVDKIVVGEVSETGEVKPNVIRFILRTGKEYKTIINNNRNKNVSLCTKDRKITNSKNKFKRIRKRE